MAMKDHKTHSNERLYQALCEKDPFFDGLFFAGITTTGIFCRSTCPARKPKFENCEFFETAQDALLAGYRSCKRCHPMGMPQETSVLVKTLIQAIENDPEKRWKAADFRALGVDESTVRRQFKKRFGVTFVAFARARRMGLAFEHIRKGGKVIDAQLDTGYESASGFRDAFSKIMGDAPKGKTHNVYIAHWLDTPLGPMVAIASNHGLVLLEFSMRRGLEREIERLREKRKAAIVPGENIFTQQIAQELEAYFKGDLKTFETPLDMMGTPFQRDVWNVLKSIPYGETRSYKDQADILGNPKAVRAVASANGCNQLAIVIPCHRVIGSDGSLTGYAGGLERKEWLLRHERTHK